MMVISAVNAYDMAVHDNGDIFVTNHRNHCVCVFDKNGQKKVTIGSRGSGNGQFKYPLGIVISGDVMLVAEFSGNRIQKLSVTGEFLMEFGTRSQEMANSLVHGACAFLPMAKCTLQNRMAE